MVVSVNERWKHKLKYNIINHVGKCNKFNSIQLLCSGVMLQPWQREPAAWLFKDAVHNCDDRRL